MELDRKTPIIAGKVNLLLKLISHTTKIFRWSKGTFTWTKNLKFVDKNGSKFEKNILGNNSELWLRIKFKLDFEINFKDILNEKSSKWFLRLEKITTTSKNRKFIEYKCKKLSFYQTHKINYLTVIWVLATFVCVLEYIWKYNRKSNSVSVIKMFSYFLHGS